MENESERGGLIYSIETEFDIRLNYMMGSNQGYSFRSNALLEKLSQTGTVRKVMWLACNKHLEGIRQDS